MDNSMPAVAARPPPAPGRAAVADPAGKTGLNRALSAPDRTLTCHVAWEAGRHRS